MQLLSGPGKPEKNATSFHSQVFSTVINEQIEAAQKKVCGKFSWVLKVQNRALQNVNWSRKICSHFIVLNSRSASDWLIEKFVSKFCLGGHARETARKLLQTKQTCVN